MINPEPSEFMYRRFVDAGTPTDGLTLADPEPESWPRFVGSRVVTPPTFGSWTMFPVFGN
jgi:hypothetical protein